MSGSSTGGDIHKQKNTKQIQKVTGNENITANGNINIFLNTLTGRSNDNSAPDSVHPTFSFPQLSKRRAVFRLIEAPTPNFVGREDLIQKIHSLLTSCSTKNEWLERTVIIHGLGGMGKSELARKYVQLHKDDPIIQNMAWIDSETYKSLEKSFRKIAGQFKLQTDKLDIEEIASNVYDHFSENLYTGLFIFDNVVQLQDEEPYFGILNYLPTQQRDKLPLILITSRINEWEAPAGENNTVRILELSNDESIRLLKAKLKLTDIQKKDSNSDIQAAISNLAQAIQGYPLGLALAAANIYCSASVNIAEEIKKYIERLDVPKSGWIDDKHSAGSASKYTLVMNNVWQATFEKIGSMGVEGECALTLLNIVAFLPTDEIEKSLVDEILEFGYPSLTKFKNDGYKYLEMFSLISFSEERASEVIIHRHVQRCTRERLDSVGDHSNLLTIGRYLCEWNKYDQVDCVKIHRQLKQRKWPENSLYISVILLSRYYRNGEYALELAKDITEAIDVDQGNSYSLLIDGYGTLLGLSLYLMSDTVFDKNDNRATAELKKLWREKNKQSFDASLKIFWNSITAQDIRSDVSTQVKDCIGDALEDLLDPTNQFKRICIKNPHSSTNPGDQTKFVTLSNVYEAINIYKRDEVDKNAFLSFKVALQLYLQSCTNDGSLQLENLPQRGPIQYKRLTFGLRESKKERRNPSVVSDWEKAIVDVILKHGGLQVVIQNLNCSNDSTYLREIIGFILLLVTEFNCSSAFKETPSFLLTLKKNAAKGVKHWWLLLWLAMFPPNSVFESPEGEKWSVDSMSGEIQTFLKDLKDFDGCWGSGNFYFDEATLIKALRPHLKLSKEEENENLNFKSAVAKMVTNNFKPSDGSAGEYTFLLDNVWNATFEKFGSMKVGGECALTLMNILAFLPTGGNMKSDIDKIFEFGYSSLKDYREDGYSILQMFSLISLIGDAKHLIRVHPQVCRFVRDRLDSQRDYSYLLGIGRYLCQSKEVFKYNSEELVQGFHRHSKQRMWPADSLNLSITFLHRHWNSKNYVKAIPELVTDLSEVMEADDDDDNSPSQLLGDEYRILLGLSLYIFAEYNCKRNKKRYEATVLLLSRCTKRYEKALDTVVEIFTTALTLKQSHLSRDVYSEVQQKLLGAIEYILDRNCDYKVLRIKLQNSIFKALDETTIGPQNSLSISRIHAGVNYHDPDGPNQNPVLGLKSALQLHIKFFTKDHYRFLPNIEYWNNNPIPYEKLKDALRESKKMRTNPLVVTEWEKSIIGTFLTHGGLQVVVQHLSSSGDWNCYPWHFINFILLLLVDYNCSEAFKGTPSFLQSLEKATLENKWIRHHYMLLWLTLFPRNCTSESTERRESFPNSVVDIMHAFLEDYWKKTESFRCLCFDLDEDLVIRILLPQLELLESNSQKDNFFKDLLVAVALMDGDIRWRKQILLRPGPQGWENVFKTKFSAFQNKPILEVGRAHGFI